MSYFGSAVQASMRKDVLTDTASEPGNKLFKDVITAEDAFKHFDANQDNKLDQGEFDKLLSELFRDASGSPHNIDPEKSKEIFAIFNQNGGDGITFLDFEKCWNSWIKTVLRPVSAIIVVDVQNDFITGSLAIKNFDAKDDGADLVPIINNILDTVPFDNIVYSQDWHPSNHISFHDNIHLWDLAEDSPIKNKSEAAEFSAVIFEGPPRINQTLWPRHCEQGTKGAEYHKDLKIHPLSLNIQKGFNPKIDSESAFFDNARLAKTELDAKLKERGVTDVFTCGIATDVCVSATSHDAIDLGYRTILIEDACGGIFPDNILKTKQSIKAKNGLVVDTSAVKDLVQGLNRPFELGYMKALGCKA